MPEFRYECVDSAGRKNRGVLEASSRAVAIHQLRKQGLVPVAIIELKEKIPATAPGFGSVSINRLSVYTRKFAELSSTDIPISEVFEILADEEEGPLLKEASQFVAHETARGSGLAAAMAQRPRVFSPLYIKMIDAGIQSGTLDLVAQNLAKLYETEHAMRQRMVSKLVYPGVVLVLCFLFAIVGKYFHAVPDHIFVNVIMIWTLIIALIAFGITRPGYQLYRQIGFKLPWIGGLMRKINLARFCRIFGLQYAAGVPILEGLDASKQVLQDPVLENAIDGMQKHINGGMELRDAMVATGVFPKRMVHMVGTGEAAGGVERMLEKLAEYYELDIETGSSIMATVIYFVVFIAVAVTVGVIVITMYMQVYIGPLNRAIEGDFSSFF